MPIHKIPLAFFAYNRPAHTANALDALYACHGRQDFEFYFFSDAARGADTENSVTEVRQLLKANVERFSAKIIERPHNLGLSKSIVDGVDSFCKSHGCVVVLEDDLIVAPDFLHFMASSIKHYENNNEIMQVGAYTIAPPFDLVTDTFLLPVTTTWGWGTWARAWEKFNWIPKGWPETRYDNKWLTRFQINGAGNYVSMLEDRLNGRNDSWGILWWYAVSRNGGQVVYPRHSLVWNGGFDGSGVHCGSGSALGQKSAVADVLTFADTITFPPKMQHRNQDFELLEAVLRGQTNIPSRVNSKIHFLFGKIRKRIRHVFS